MEQNGFTVAAEEVQDLAAVEARYLVPKELQSCHIAIVDGYIIEGHVPAAEVQRMLDERPDIIGLAVVGMPLGSPGMGGEGSASEPFDVIAFGQAGRIEVFASYP
ncbi:MAG: hypothetical protein BMS9Abin28_0206 [Anaerolineae bacterium]|nr:MAG: hypothetical protein BMS9Abin28_0206 [Anaerolineae bacterium]